MAVDDASRVAYAEILPDERGDTTSGFLRRSVAWFARLGVRVQVAFDLTRSGSTITPGIYFLQVRDASGQTSQAVKVLVLK